MTRPALFACVFALALPACNQSRGGGGGGNVNLDSDEHKTLYALGVLIGQRTGIANFKLSADELRYVEAGFGDIASGQKSKVELEQYGPRVNQMMRKRQEERAEGEKKKGEEFADKAAKEPGAERTASGMVFKEITPGTGEQPKATDVVKVNYKGTLIDGTEFDSSYKRGQPATFPLMSVIPCWTEGLQKMKVGGKAKLVCPSKIAYGDNGRPPTIPGGATLQFEVELLGIEKQPQQPAMPQLSLPGHPGALPPGAHTAPASGTKVTPPAGHKTAPATK